MDKKELLKNIAADSETENLLLSEIQRQLDEEISKPFRKRDFDKIEELTSRVRELSESEKAIQLRDECGKKYLLEKAEEKPKKRSVKLPAAGFAAALCCLALVLGLNVYSFSTLGMDIFSAVVKYTQGGVSLDFSKPDDGSASEETSDADSYGIKAKCAEYGVECAAPEYIPNGFELSDFQSEELSGSTNCYFYFSRNDSIFNFTIENYNSTELIPTVLIPNDNHDVKEEIFNGNLVYIMNEQKSYTAVYSSGKTVYLLYAEGLDYEELKKILESME